MSGAALFARYAFPPNELGYCGPDGAHALLPGDGSPGVDEVDVARRARLFDGAWPYLEIIAAAAGITDPLDERVVEAYWIGSDLLQAVDGRASADRLRSTFRGQVTSRLGTTRSAVAHHSFHVFAVYPWVAMLGRGNDAPALAILDQCRIRWGPVTAVKGNRAAVTLRPLTCAQGELRFGDPESRWVRWAVDGNSLVPRVEVGDVVAVHWDWVCDLLDPLRSAALDRWSAAALRACELDSTGAPRGRATKEGPFPG